MAYKTKKKNYKGPLDAVGMSPTAAFNKLREFFQNIEEARDKIKR